MIENDEKMSITLPDGFKVPRLGQGTWFMGEDRSKKEEEIEALRTGIELGMTLIDTAEMYGEGKSETLIGKAIKEINRDKLFLVSKVYPHNAGRNKIFKSCENSLKRLGVESLDLYLLHWRGNVPLKETVECMEKLVSDGMIKRWGVSNFDTLDMEELWSVPNGNKCAINQVLYHLGSRGIEFDLIPWLKGHNVPVMAYCPIAQGGDLRHGLMSNSSVINISQKYNATPAQILLSFVLHNNNVIAIPKAGTITHVKENAQAGAINLTDEDIKELSKAFPAPNRKTYLDIV
jgi:diketogulonate reductase-like aldo/keto reductase